MPLSVRLDRKTERVVKSLATKRRQTKSEVIRDAIGLLASQEAGSERKNRPYDLIAHLIGCVDTGGARLSERTGEKLARLLREKAHARDTR